MNILIIDDERLSRLTIKQQLDSSPLRNSTLLIDEAENAEKGDQLLSTRLYDLVFIDLKLDESSELSGLKLIPIARKKGTYTVVMTSIDDEEVTELAYDNGCQDVYVKGNEREHISETLNRYFMSKQRFDESLLFDELVPTKNTEYQENLRKLLRIIPTDLPISLLGESGTGKSHLAKIIHQLSKRPGEFIEINCAAFKGDTLKSELFGHVKGSFTGSTDAAPGKLLLANEGTLFLDEIGSMSLEMQEILLKAIEEKSFYPLGSTKKVSSNFRVITATLDDFGDLIQKGKFRFDLFQRINGYSFTQPSLKDRQEDIIPLLKSKLDGTRKIIIKKEAEDIFKNHNWPGNIRELVRVAELILHSDSGIIKSDLALELTDSSQVSATEVDTLLTDMHYKLIEKMGMRNFLDLLSKEIVLKALDSNNGKATKAIKELGISSATFYKYFDKNQKDHYDRT